MLVGRYYDDQVGEYIVKARKVVRRAVYMALIIIIQPRNTWSQEVLTIPKTLHQRCDTLEDPASCYELGLLYYKAGSAKKKEGERLVRRGCRLELGRECPLSEGLERAAVSESAQKKVDKAIQQEQVRVLEGEMTKEEIACWDGSHEACNQSATHYYFLATPTNEKKGVELFKEGCRLGNRKSCSSLKLLEEGKVKVFSVEVDE